MCGREAPIFWTLHIGKKLFITVFFITIKILHQFSSHFNVGVCEKCDSAALHPTKFIDLCVISSWGQNSNFRRAKTNGGRCKQHTKNNPNLKNKSAFIYIWSFKHFAKGQIWTFKLFLWRLHFTHKFIYSYACTYETYYIHLHNLIRVDVGWYI